MTPRGESRWKLGTRAPRIPLFLGVLLVLGLVQGPSLAGLLTARARLADGVASVSAPASVRVSLAFDAQNFHIRTLSRYGVYAGTPSKRKVNIVQVSPANVRALARVYWIEKVEPIQ